MGTMDGRSSPGEGWADRLQCPHLGNRYLPPRGGGAFRCPVCSRPISTPQPREARRGNATAIVLSLLLAGVVVTGFGLAWKGQEARSVQFAEHQAAGERFVREREVQRR